MVFSHVTLRRYTQDKQEVRADAGLLERYDSDKVWAGSMIGFTQYDLETEKESVKGSTGLMLVNEAAKEYYLGNKVFCHTLEDDFTVRSTALIWKETEGLLAAPVNESVRVTHGDGLTIEGKGFSANTKTKTFMFKTGTSGTIIVDNKESD